MVGAIIGAAVQHNKKKFHAIHETLTSRGLLPHPISNRVSDNRDQLQKSPQKVPFKVLSGQRTAVLLTAGQSNAANHGAVGEALPSDAP